MLTAVASSGFSSSFTHELHNLLERDLDSAQVHKLVTWVEKNLGLLQEINPCGELPLNARLPPWDLSHGSAVPPRVEASGVRTPPTNTIYSL